MYLKLVDIISSDIAVIVYEDSYKLITGGKEVLDSLSETGFPLSVPLKEISMLELVTSSLVTSYLYNSIDNVNLDNCKIYSLTELRKRLARVHKLLNSNNTVYLHTKYGEFEVHKYEKSICSKIGFLHTFTVDGFRLEIPLWEIEGISTDSNCIPQTGDWVTPYISKSNGYMVGYPSEDAIKVYTSYPNQYLKYFDIPLEQQLLLLNSIRMGYKDYNNYAMHIYAILNNYDISVVDKEIQLLFVNSLARKCKNCKDLNLGVLAETLIDFMLSMLSKNIYTKRL